MADSGQTDDTKEILRLSIREMRKTFEHVSNIYDQLRLKALGVLAGEVAIVTFIFSDKGIPMPQEVYGKMFLFTGAIFLASAFGLLLWTLSSMPWKIPYDMYSATELKQKFQSEQEFLEYLNDDYVDGDNHCLKYVSLRAKRFSWTIYLLSAGAIILVLIKFGSTR